MPEAASAAVTMIGALALVGWLLDIDLLTRILPGSVSMNPMTAICFILACGAVWFSKPETTEIGRNLPRRRIAMACAALVAAIGLARLLGYVFGWDFGVDRLLFADKLGQPGGDLPNRMAPNTAINFCLLGAAVLLIDARERRWRWLAQSAVLAATLTAFVAFLGHTLGARGLYQPLPYIGMAINTALCFIFLGLGILAARPDQGAAAIISSPYLGGTMARRILPAAVLVPLAIGWLRLWGQHLGLYGTEFGLGIMMTACVILLAALAIHTAASLNRTDAERRKAEETIRVSERRLAHALDIAESAIISVDDNQRIVFFDERCERAFGYAAGEVLGQPVEMLLPARFAETHREHVRAFASSPESSRWIGTTQEVFGRRKDGSEFPAEAAVSKSSRDGAVLFTAVLRDITERKRAMEETLKAERLEAANKELEAFSYSVSHDLRAPLRHIDGFIDLLGSNASSVLDEQSRRYLAIIADSAKRMGVLIDDLLSFSRMTRSAMTKTRTSLRTLLDEAIKDLAKETEGRTIEWRLAELPEVECDPPMMRQVFANLIGNAVKFTRATEKAVIEVGALDDKPDRATVYVRDNGVGFDMQYKNKLFGVFQRLHRQDEFEGTGIGLANVRRIIHRHGGETWAESEPGRGAVFYFSLPVIAKEAKS